MGIFLLIVVFEMARAGKIRMVVSPSILAEPATILKSKFTWDDADWIVSGDHHLLDLKEFQGIQIARVSDFLSIVGEGATVIEE